MAVILGIILVLAIRPGDRGDKPQGGGKEFRKVEPADTFLDLIRWVNKAAEITINYCSCCHSQYYYKHYSASASVYVIGVNISLRTRIMITYIRKAPLSSLSAL